MQRSVKVTWSRVQVGLLLMFAAAVLLYASITGGGTSIFDSKKSFVAYFKNVDGLVTGSPVWMSGLEVGNVASIEITILDSARVIQVRCRVVEDVWPFLTENARVELGTIGFLGDKFVNVIPGEFGGTPIPEGGVVLVQDVGSAKNMFAAGEQAFENAESVVFELDTLLSRMNRGEGTLGHIATDEQLYDNLSSLLADLTTLTRDLQKNQERLTASIESMSGSVGSLAAKVDSNTGTMGRLFNDPQLYDNLTATSARLDSILTKIDMAEGNAGLLVNDTAMYVEMVNLMARANNLISDIQANPRRYFKFSVF
ncbi:MCE family protein [candidate division GN15 bacterium]|nr:MCE family protein [candidate division GN15 bacterium]